MVGRIASDFIDELLSRVDIIDILSSRIPIKKKGANHLACCPFHQEKSPSFSANQAKQFYYCFGCGAHGNALKFVMEYDNLSFVEAVEELAEHESIDIRYDSRQSHLAPAEQRQTLDLYELLDKSSNYYQQVLKSAPEAINYLKSRGISGKTAKRFCIGFAPKGWDNILKQHNNQLKPLLESGLIVKNDRGRTYDRFRHRIVFPIHDRRGRTIGFGGRTLSADETPKYLNSPETSVFIKGRELYGLFEAKKTQRSLDKILIVEGYMDVISLAEQGINYAVATLGTATTKEHLKLLFKEVRDITFCFDGDNAGKEAAKRALKIALPFMSGDYQINFLFLPEGEDPDSLVQKIGKQAFEAKMAIAIPLSEKLLSSLTRSLNLNTVDGKARLISEIRPFINLIPEGIFLTALIDKLARLTHLTASSIQLTLQEQPTTVKTNADQLSLSQIALSYIMQEPAIGLDLPSLMFDTNTEDKRLLSEIIQLIAMIKPQNSGILIQHLSNHKYIEQLVSLASRHNSITDTSMRKKELTDIILKLNKEEHTQAIDLLIEKSKINRLSQNEKKQLLELLCTSSKTQL